MSWGPRAGGGGWAYLRLVSALPVVSLDPRAALAVQFVAFEGVAVGLAAGYGAWGALPLATAAIVVSTLGSALMSRLADRIRALDPPARYRGLLFDSSVDVLMGLVAFVLLVTHLLVGGGGSGAGALERLLGRSPPAPVVVFALFVAWDLAYRIGIGWWASITGLWRAVTLGGQFDAGTRAAYARADALTIGFAALQLLLVPFVATDRLLVGLLVGHVLAVVVVSGLAVAVGRR